MCMRWWEDSLQESFLSATEWREEVRSAALPVHAWEFWGGICSQFSDCGLALRELKAQNIDVIYIWNSDFFFQINAYYYTFVICKCAKYFLLEIEISQNVLIFVI